GPARCQLRRKTACWTCAAAASRRGPLGSRLPRYPNKRCTREQRPPTDARPRESSSRSHSRQGARRTAQEIFREIHEPPMRGADDNGVMTFPHHFLWGAATAAYQVEGGRGEDGMGPSVWDMFCRKPGAVLEGHK